MRKPKLLLTRLHDTMFEIYILLPQLRLKLPKIKSVDLRILQTMWPSLDTPLEQIKVFLVYKIPDLHLSIEAPAVKYGGWFMKLKIFIGFAQCFCYFPMTFNVRWPEDLLQWMRWLEFTSIDFYAVFGNVSCRLQTGFLQKFVFHMALFPMIVAMIGIAYIVTKLTRCRKGYTSESVQTQTITLTLFMAFTLYTGICTRIFRLFKCRNVEGTWYLMADYTVKCREGEWNFFAAVACICIAVYIIGLPGFELYYLMRNRKNLHLKTAKTLKNNVR